MSSTKLSFIVRNSAAPHFVDVEDGVTVIIGRASDDQFSIQRTGLELHVRVPLSTLSERHARIVAHRGAIHVEDLASRNGTLRRLRPHVPAELTDDPIWLGPDLVVRREEHEAPNVVEPSLTSEEFVRWLNARLIERGLSVSLCDPSADSVAIAGSRQHIRLSDAPGRQHTIDVIEHQWLRAAVARFNAAKSNVEALNDWRFQAASTSRRDTLTLAADVARTRLSVLLLGESGSGKDVLAQDIHEHSLARSGPWVPVNCAALPNTLVESELFGHTRGAFTGATHEKIGLVQAADHGTLFLDEVGDLSEAAQAVLLRFLESERGEYRRVGETKLRYARVRVIAATNRDLHAAMRSGAFRADLFHRLAAIQIRVAPPGREDLRAIAHQLFSAAAVREGVSVDHGVLARLADLAASRDWPGHVRELRHCIERWAQAYAPRFDAVTAWHHASAQQHETLKTVSKPTAVAPPTQPALLGRKIADAIFLGAALSATSRSALARALDVTYQGADRRLDALQLSIDDKAAIAAKLDELVVEIQSVVRATADLQLLFNRFNEG